MLPGPEDLNFWTPDLWCLFDAKEKPNDALSRIPYEDCNIVLSTCPRPDLVNDFKKAYCTTYYMPVWEEREMRSIATCFTQPTWESRFAIRGGVPRLVFENGDDPYLLLEQACCECDLQDCTKIIGFNSKVSDKHKLPHVIVHMSSSEPHTGRWVQYASNPAMATIIRLKRVDARRNMPSLLESCQDMPHAAALCGHIFEDHALDLLQKGGTFRCRQLFQGKTRVQKPRNGSLLIPASGTRIPAVDVDSTQASGQLYVASTKNFTAIEAWIPGIGAFQMTVARVPEIKGNTEEKLRILGRRSVVL